MPKSFYLVQHNHSSKIGEGERERKETKQNLKIKKKNSCKQIRKWEKKRERNSIRKNDRKVVWKCYFMIKSREKENFSNNNAKLTTLVRVKKTKKQFLQHSQIKTLLKNSFKCAF